jgi:hypothetical protein
MIPPLTYQIKSTKEKQMYSLIRSNFSGKPPATTASRMSSFVHFYAETFCVSKQTKSLGLSMTTLIDSEDKTFLTLKFCASFALFRYWNTNIHLCRVEATYA